ncbi:hypothetical protein ESZ39_10660 [Colwellia sp. C1TZA3]|nr:hypothetical protein ESZ39_10660 [Colwellia sp. C1TZA3]
MLLSIPIASYCSIERLTLSYFYCAQQDHLINQIGITYSLTTNTLVTKQYVISVLNSYALIN